MTKIKQPKIRFKGYINDWEQRKLGEIAKRVVRKNKNLESNLPLTISAQYGLVDQETYFNKQIASKDISNYYLLEKGEFAYNKSYSKDYPWGTIKRLDKFANGVLSTLYIVFKPVSVDSNYLVSYYDSTYWHKEVSMRASEGARNHGLLNITAKDFFDTDLKLPVDNKEQSKIGEFFKTLDNTIALHEQKLEVTKQFKQTMLKKMFPKNGETTPEIRFKGFTDDWENEKFLDICSVKKGTQLNKDTLSREKTETFKYPVYNGSINPIGYTTEYNKEKGLIMTEGGDVGRVLFSETPFWSSGHSYNITSGDNNIYYLQYLFEYNYGKINSKGLGVTIKNLSLSSLKQIILTVSSSYQEQELIGNHFKELDNQIKSLEQKLETYKEFKKAMLQKMFI